MASLWPWMAVAGLGALHGLNPATGWFWAAAWGLRSGEPWRALAALVPIAAGHAASVAVVATAVAMGLSAQGLALRIALAAVLVIAMRHRGSKGHAPARSRASGHAGLALWSFTVATGHGAGMMLVPALIPFCLGEGAAGREIMASGSLTLALAAMGLHMAAMIAVTGAMAIGACRGVNKATAGWFFVRQLR